MERYDQTPGAVLPNNGVDGTPKRFLRHEAIAAPLLMLPASLVASSNGPMGFEPPATVTLRSANAGDALQDGQRDEDPPGPAYLPADKRKSEDVSYRVLVAPLAGMDFCARHGVFDDPKTVKKVFER